MQSLQVFELDLIVGEALPGAHAVQFEAAAKRHVQAAQSVQTSVATTAKVPELEYRPASHTHQVVLLQPPVEAPMGQRLQLLLSTPESAPGRLSGRRKPGPQTPLG